MKNKFSDIRNDYGNRSLEESEMPSDPIGLTQEWLNEAIKEGLYEPTAISLSTIDFEGYPTSRIVLLKSILNSKFIFFSNYNSAKAKELENTSKAGILFFWPQLHRQIRITGKVKKISELQSEEYFNERPVESKIGAWASAQSEPIKDRDFLESNYNYYKKKFNSQTIPRPEFWGGYELEPVGIEFWQGRSKRLHDRMVYRKNDSAWVIERLAP